MHKTDGNGGFTSGSRFGWRHTGTGVGADILVQRTHVVEGFVFAHELDQSRDDGVRRTAGSGIRHLDLAFELRLQEIGPRRGRRHFLLGQQLGVVAKAQRAKVDADRVVLGIFGLTLSPGVQGA